MTTPLPKYNSLTAAASIVPPKRNLAPSYDSWQDQLWNFYDVLGEFEDGVSWKANTISRVRLLAAEISPGGDEPVRLEEGPAVEAMSGFAGGTDGQSQLLKELTVHLGVPGEAWLVGERGIPIERQQEDGLLSDEQWSVRSADEIKVSTRGGSKFEVRVDDKNWRPLSDDSIVLRAWDPHPRRSWEADSAGRHAITTLTKLDLLNKRIIATIISRLAMNGIFLYDQDKLSAPTFEGPTEDADTNVDPFARLFVDAAGRGIADPTSAEAVIAIPIGFSVGDGENVNPELIARHLTFANEVDPKLLEIREATIRELARSMDMPAEIMLGIGDVNHWGAWQIEESGIKIYISPTMETICHALTKGFLIPSLKAGQHDLTGPNGGRIICWYDVSEITARPDKSTSTQAAYDRFEASGTALRRESGLDEDDAPNADELEEMILKRLVMQPANSLTALSNLTSLQVAQPAPEEEETTEELDDEQEERDIPDTQEEPPPAPDDEVEAIAAAAPRSALVTAGTVVERATRRNRNGDSSE